MGSFLSSLERHGWFVHGLDTRGEAWNASSPTLVLRGHVPEYLCTPYLGNGACKIQCPFAQQWFYRQTYEYYPCAR
eukprot:154744-Amphidinium_carterae.1